MIITYKNVTIKFNLRTIKANISDPCKLSVAVQFFLTKSLISYSGSMRAQVSYLDPLDTTPRKLITSLISPKCREPRFLIVPHFFRHLSCRLFLDDFLREELVDYPQEY